MDRIEEIRAKIGECDDIIIEQLLREAKEAGCTCIGGKGMLLWQGVAAFKLYTGQDMPVEDVKKLFFS
jgi:quinate/shikimate dehydrogenase